MAKQKLFDRKIYKENLEVQKTRKEGYFNLKLRPENPCSMPFKFY